MRNYYVSFKIDNKIDMFLSENSFVREQKNVCFHIRICIVIIWIIGNDTDFKAVYIIEF